MAREKKDYRAILEDILRFTDGRRAMSAGEVCTYLGLSRPTVKRRYGIGKDGVMAPALAMKLAGGIDYD